MKKHPLFYLIVLMMSVLTMASCGETDGEVEEYADWQNKNDTYFTQLYASTQQRIAKGDASWKIIRNWSLPDDNEHFHAELNNYIIVHVLESGHSTSGSPLYTDSVQVNYRARLIPSASYAAGYVFDKSYSGAYDPQAMIPSKLAVSSVVDGFATALMNMTIGDRWEVYIPYRLGYGDKEQSVAKIPAYSTLIFDMGLAGFFSAKAPESSLSAKSATWTME